MLKYTIIVQKDKEEKSTLEEEIERIVTILHVAWRTTK